MNDEYPFSDSPTIDDAVATPLKDLLGDSYFELVNDFTNDFPVKFSALKKASDTHNVDGIFKVAHTLKSSSGSFGFTKLYKQLEHLELQARNNEITNLSAQIDLLQQEFNIVVTSINKEK